MRSVSPQQQLDLFYSMPGDIAARDAQDLMSWPFFSLAKSRRSAPIDFAMGATWISVEAVAEHGMATIWDADILIWAASQLVEARDAGRPTSRHDGEAQCSPAPGNGAIGPRGGTCASTHLSKVAVSGAVPALGMKAVGSDAGSLSITVNRVSIVVPCLR